MAQFRRVKKAATIAVTFAFALSIGYVMQYGDADASRFADNTPDLQRTVLPAQLDTSPLQPADSLAPKLETPVVQRITDADDEDALRVDPSTVKLTALVVDAVRSGIPDASDADDLTKASSVPSCDINLATAIAEQATVLLTVQSTCRADMPFEILHNGMVLTAATDALGQASVSVPALSANASLFITFADGSGATAAAVVPEVEALNRVVLQWDDLEGELIQTADLEASMIGHIARYGEAADETAHFVEVFTFPASLSTGEALDALTVQAPVTEESCGQTLRGQVFHVLAGAEPAFKDIRITLPGCEHVGTFLELKKVLGGQTLLPR